MATKTTVFQKIKELHSKATGAAPQILVSTLQRDLLIDLEEVQRHLTALSTMQLIKFKGTSKMAIELTKSGLTTTMRSAVTAEPVAPVIERERV